ncbi:MAG: hypothetical protein KAW12_28300, partial [Candidatus Aminicenantes bacterium]|nr:hypothetical protein [Candidatus Aminicenantes bacterium]
TFSKVWPPAGPPEAGNSPLLCSGIRYYKLTIHRDIQEKLHRLFRGYHGSFLLLDLSNGSIAAAYSKPLNKKKMAPNAVFFEEYEPASIIKVLTLFAYLKHDGGDLFPLDCKGNIRLSGKTFYDWIAHGRVSSYDEALAVSCNIAFARMGLKTGADKLTGVLEKFYFNSENFRDLFLDFKTGTLKRDIAGDFHLAKLSVGLSNNNEKSRSRGERLVTTTTFHSALTAAFIAHDGAIYAPHLIENIKNLLNLGFYSHQKKLLEIFKENMIFLKIKEAMKAVVTSPGGTGRRSRVDFVETAVKTGTGGERRAGYDAILTGFFPAGKARYAFAFRLQRAGKAELKGALFLKDFLKSFYNRK